MAVAKPVSELAATARPDVVFWVTEPRAAELASVIAVMPMD